MKIEISALADTPRFAIFEMGSTLISEPQKLGNAKMFPNHGAQALKYW